MDKWPNVLEYSFAALILYGFFYQLSSLANPFEYLDTFITVQIVRGYALQIILSEMSLCAAMLLIQDLVTHISCGWITI